MSAFLVQLALSNLLASAALAGAAYIVHRHGRYPSVAHLLWVVVLLKLVTPPLLLVPMVPLAMPDAAAAAGAAGDPGPALAAASATTAADGGLAQHALALLLAAWAAGSLVVLTVSLVRIARFDRMLRHGSGEAPPAIAALAGGIAARFELSRTPAIRVTPASISPLTWWTGRRVLVVLPASLVAHMTADRLRWVLAHELAHVKRRDHLVRWLEWLACVSFWWNPIAWWARRKLHQDEEASCDAFVIQRLETRPRSYAKALLEAVELLARGTLQPPAVATGIDGAGSLERRFALIVSGRPVQRAPRSLMAAMLVPAIALLPLGAGSTVQREPEPTDPITRAAGPVTRAAVAASEDASANGEARYRLLGAVIDGVDALRDAAVSGGSTASGVVQAERKLELAERKVRKVERQLRRDVAAGQTERALRAARLAVRKAEVVVEQLAEAPTSVERGLRDVKQALRQASRALRRSASSD